MCVTKMCLTLPVAVSCSAGYSKVKTYQCITITIQSYIILPRLAI